MLLTSDNDQTLFRYSIERRIIRLGTITGNVNCFGRTQQLKSSTRRRKDGRLDDERDHSVPARS